MLVTINYPSCPTDGEITLPSSTINWETLINKSTNSPSNPSSSISLKATHLSGVYYFEISRERIRYLGDS